MPRNVEWVIFDVEEHRIVHPLVGGVQVYRRRFVASRFDLVGGVDEEGVEILFLPAALKEAAVEQCGKLHVVLATRVWVWERERRR